MLRVLLLLRFLMLAASLGALIGALLMWGLAGSKLAHGGGSLLSGHLDPREITASVMGAIDALLFGVVLMIFALAIAFGFVFEPQASLRVPAWMRPKGIGELKRTLVEVILVYLIVDFATDLSQEEITLGWTNLVIPLSVLLIAAAMRLLPAHEKHPHGGATAPHAGLSEPRHPPRDDSREAGH